MNSFQQGDFPDSSQHAEISGSPGTWKAEGKNCHT